MNFFHVRVKKLPSAAGLPMPSYATSGSAGADVYAADDVLLLASQRALVPTGIVLELPADMEAQVRPRSGLALRHGITVLNSPGTIDSDYRGEVKVLLINHGEHDVNIKRGERIAQLVFSQVKRAVWVSVDDIEITGRGDGGFGSTGSE